MMPHSVVMMLIHFEGWNFLRTRLEGSSEVWEGVLYQSAVECGRWGREEGWQVGNVQYRSRIAETPRFGTRSP